MDPLAFSRFLSPPFFSLSLALALLLLCSPAHCSPTPLSFFAFSVSRFSFSIPSGAHQASLPPSRALKSSLKCDGNTLPPPPSPPRPLSLPSSRRGVPFPRSPTTLALPLTHSLSLSLLGLFRCPFPQRPLPRSNRGPPCRTDYRTSEEQKPGARARERGPFPPQRKTPRERRRREITGGAFSSSPLASPTLGFLSLALRLLPPPGETTMKHARLALARSRRDRENHPAEKKPGEMPGVFASFERRDQRGHQSPCSRERRI